MRHLRVTFGLAAMVCAFALAATPALAHEFLTNKEGKTKGSTETLQYFKFGPFKVKCEKITGKGMIVQGSTQVLSVKLKPAKCLTSAKIGAKEFFIGTAWRVPLAIEYHANGWIKTGSEVLLNEETGQWYVGGPAAMFHMKTGRTEEFEKSECEVFIPPQTVPGGAIKHPEEEWGEATFLNKMFPHKITNKFPTGEQPGLMITNTIAGLHYELEGEPCEEWGKEEEPEGGGGVYEGKFPQVLAGGTLEYF
jgi:hypothetical protein